MAKAGAGSPTLVQALLDRGEVVCPVHERISRAQHAHTVQCYPAFKRKHILTHAATRMTLEDLMRSYVSRSQKNKHCPLDSTCMSYFEWSSLERWEVD